MIKDPVKQRKQIPPIGSTFGSGGGAGLLGGSLLLLAITILVYWPALRNGFLWDDDVMVTQNRIVQANDGLKRLWFSTEPVDYFPLTYSSFWLEWRFWKMNPLGYHVTNILIHGLSVAILWRVLGRLWIPGAWWGAALFAVHPVNVESVAWIAERKNTLAMVFYVLTAWLYLKAKERRLNETKNNKETLAIQSSGKFYWLSLMAFLLALLSKTSVVMLPCALLLCDWWLARRPETNAISGGPPTSRFWISSLIRLAPFFCLSLLLSLVTIWFQYNRAIQMDTVNSNSFCERLALAGYAVWFYVFKALAPLQLIAVYPRWTLDAHQFATYLPAIAVPVALSLLWFLRKRWSTAVLFGLFYFVVTLFPVLGFFNIYFQRFSPVADHWQYFSLIGITCLIAAGFVEMLRGYSTVALALVGIVYCAFTWNHTKNFKDEETLWRDTVKKNPDSWLSRQNLATILAAKGNIKEAEEQLKTAVSPGSTPATHPATKENLDAANAAFSKGLVLLANEDLDGALTEFQKALELRPDWTEVMNEVAWIRATHPNPDRRNGLEAVTLAKRACELTQYKEGRFVGTLDASYAAAGQFKEAISTAEKARDLFLKEGKVELAQEAMTRIKLYQAGVAYHR